MQTNKFLLGFLLWSFLAAPAFCIEDTVEGTPIIREDFENCTPSAYIIEGTLDDMVSGYWLLRTDSSTTMLNTTSTAPDLTYNPNLTGTYDLYVGYSAVPWWMSFGLRLSSESSSATTIITAPLSLGYYNPDMEHCWKRGVTMDGKSIIIDNLGAGQCIYLRYLKFVPVSTVTVTEQGEKSVICQIANKHVAFPGITRAANGDLLVTARSATGHRTSDGDIVLVRSTNNGVSWGSPTTIYDDTTYGNAGAGMIATLSDDSIMTVIGGGGGYTTRVMKVSTDNGSTWSTQTADSKIENCRSEGLVEGPNGDLFFIGYRKNGNLWYIEIERSQNGGSTWSTYSTLSGGVVADSIVWGEDLMGLPDEPHLCILPNDRWIVMARRHNETLLQFISTDAGASWTADITPIWGWPAHLYYMDDGTLVCTYSYRKPPYGVRACISYDRGATWDMDNEIILRADGYDWDMGYPQSITLDGDKLLTVYYMHVTGPSEVTDWPYIAGTSWYPGIFRPIAAETNPTVFSTAMEEGSGSTIQDSINSNTGTISNATWSTGGGISGDALIFNGTDADVDFGSSPTGIDLSGSQSMSAWVKPDTNSGQQTVVAKGMWNSGMFTDSGALRGYIASSGTSASSQSNETLTTGEWQHVAMTFDVDGDKKIHLYINGREVSYLAQIAMVGTPSTNNHAFTIGSNIGTSNWFDGMIDEVKVFNEAICEREVFDEYATVFYAPLNENSGTAVAETRNDNDGTASGVQWVPGVSGNALLFDGTNDDVDFSTPTILELTGSRSMSAWVKPEGNSGHDTIAAKGMWGSGLFTTDGALRGYIYSSGTSASSQTRAALTPGVWQHVAMTFDADNDKKVHLYINGKEAGYTTQVAMSGSPSSTSSYDFAIGSDRGLDYWFDGRIDDVKVFRQALAPQDVFEEYATVFKADFDEDTSGCTTAYESRNGNNGTISGTTWTTGVSGSALLFNGSSDYVDFGNPAALDIPGSRTISAWVKPDTNGDYNTIAAKGMWASGLFTTAGKLRGYIFSDGTSASSQSTASLTTGVWQHVAMTFDIDGDKKIHLYVNGEEVSCAAKIAMVGVPVHNDYDFTVGADQGSNYFFDGAIDEVKVFKRALSTRDIFNEYATSLDVSLNEGTGDKVTDAGKEKLHGTRSGATWTTGVTGNALDFDGSNDDVDFGKQAALDFSGSRSISAWIKPDTNGSYEAIAGKSMWASGLFTTTGRIRGSVNGSSANARSMSNESLSTGVWQHVAMTFDYDGDQKVHLYINGEEVTYAEQTTMSGTPVDTSSYDFTIGSDRGFQYWFDGAIDDVKVFSRALSAQQVFDEYATVFDANIDENTGTTVYDSRNGNNGVVDGAAWTTGINGSALDFDGSDDSVDFNDPGVLELTGSRTIAAWIKPDSNGSYNAIATKWAFGSGLFVSNGHLRGYIRSSGTAASSQSSTTLSTGVWQHVAMTFDINGDKYIRLYVNGSEVASYSIWQQMTGTPLSNGSYSFAIGSSRGVEYFFDGAIDDVKVYKVPLSSSQITDIYNEYGE